MKRLSFLAILLFGLPAFSQVSVLKTEQLRLEQGKRLAAGREMRSWHFTSFPEPMQDWPKEVKGAFLELRCEDNPFSEAALIVVRDDFRLRAYPAKCLTTEDRALAEKLEAERAARFTPEPGPAYQADHSIYDPKRDAAKVSFSESPHFTFYVGKDRKASGKLAIEDPGFIPDQKRWFEKVWDHLTVAGAPMPMATEPEPKKINVYITGTGLEKHPDGFAFGGDSVLMHPAALGKGSSVVVHEFTHSVQFFSKGYRDTPFVGWFWECHANWSTHQFMPAYPPVLAHYAGRAHYELNSSRHNYGSWPFLQVLAENPAFGPAYPYQIWTACKRDSNEAALEDPFQTIMRTGAEKGVWKDGVEGFGDVIGELAARMVAWDFQNQFYHTKEMRDYVRYNEGIPSHRVILQPVPELEGFWSPVFSHAPRQFGVNLIDLETTGGGVEVEFKGIVDDTEGSDWRVTLVAHDKLGNCRYSPTVRQGKLSFDVREGETLTLAVAATPTVYKQLDFRMGFNRKPRFPYEVSFRNARPVQAPPMPILPVVDGAPHPNGGGFVGAGAKVAESAYVGPEARVLDGAQVSGNARIEGHAVVMHGAKVRDEAVVGGYARVTQEAVVSGRAKVSGFARVGERATLTDDARLTDYVTVDGDGRIEGNVLVKGFGEIHTRRKTVLCGDAICGEDLEVHFEGHDQPVVDKGMLYGFMNSEFLKKDLTDHHGLHAHWDFDSPHGQVLKDVNADCDGVVRGKLSFRESDGRRVAVFDAGSTVQVDGSLLDARNLTLDLVVKPAGDSPSQILKFGDKTNGLAIGIGADHKLALTCVRDGKVVPGLSTTSVPAGRWSRLTVSVKGVDTRFFIDGKPAGGIRNTAVLPSEPGVGAGWIGSGFAGEIDDIKVYRKGIERIEELP